MYHGRYEDVMNKPMMASLEHCVELFFCVAFGRLRRSSGKQGSLRSGCVKAAGPRVGWRPGWVHLCVDE